MSEKTIAFGDILSFLPECDGPNTFPFLRDSSDFRYVLNENSCFVAPTLRVEREPPEGKTPSVILISAPAAVGKSTVAEALGYLTQAPLWNLAKFNLGHGTFSGIPRRFYGGEQFNEVEKRLRAGNFLFILDALDEARAKKPDFFESFLEELCEEAQSTRPKTSLVLLGRTEASTWASIYLEDSGVPFAQYSINFFDRPQAEEFVDNFLDLVAEKEEKEPFHRDRHQRSNFVETRDLLFSRVYKVLEVASTAEPWQEAVVLEFLGYAPVLEVLAKFLWHPNYHKFKNQISELGAHLYATDPSRAWKFLRQIVTDLLEREHDKTVKPLKERLVTEANAVGWDDWDSLYRHDEQCERVLSHVLKLRPSLPSENLPVKIQQAYSETLKSCIGDHAFLKDECEFTNVVFRDYLFVWALRMGPVAIKERVESWLVLT